MKKTVIDGIMYTVTTINEYLDNPDMYNRDKTLVEHNGYILPIKADASSLSDEVGAYVFSDKTPFCYIVNDPVTEDDMIRYSNSRVEDYSKAETTAELLRSRDNINNMEREILTSSDNITTLPIGENDQPEAIAFKQAINMKHIDVNSYKYRMGDRASNDIRRLTDPRLSIKKLKELGDVYDMKITLRIEDASPDVCNPMNDVIEVQLTQNGTNALDETID